MKRLFPLLLILLLLAGCGLLESEEQLPEESYAYSGYAAETVDPLFPQEKQVVKTVLSAEGEIPLSNPTRSYSYRLPMIDLGGAQAMGINQELEDRFGTLIRQSLKAMEEFDAPILERLSYRSFTWKGILTLRVDRLDCDGASVTAYYTAAADSGNAVSVRELFDAAGLTGEPETLVNQAVTELFVQRFGALDGADAQYTTALNRTLGALQPLSANRMHLTENGGLVAALELFDPKGGSSVVELPLRG